MIVASDLQKALDDYRKQIAGPIRGRLEQALRAEAPVGKTGDTKRNTKVRIASNNRRELRLVAEVNVPYAAFPEEGTRPHVIVPRNARVLSFFWPKLGRRVFFAKVNHPGNPPRPWFRPTLTKWTEIIREVVR